MVITCRSPNEKLLHQSTGKAWASSSYDVAGDLRKTVLCILQNASHAQLTGLMTFSLFKKPLPLTSGASEGGRSCQRIEALTQPLSHVRRWLPRERTSARSIFAPHMIPTRQMHPNNAGTSKGRKGGHRPRASTSLIACACRTSGARAIRQRTDSPRHS